MYFCLLEILSRLYEKYIFVGVKYVTNPDLELDFVPS